MADFCSFLNLQILFCLYKRLRSYNEQSFGAFTEYQAPTICQLIFHLLTNWLSASEWQNKVCSETGCCFHNPRFKEICESNRCSEVAAGAPEDRRRLSRGTSGMRWSLVEHVKTGWGRCVSSVCNSCEHCVSDRMSVSESVWLGNEQTTPWRHHSPIWGGRHHLYLIMIDYSCRQVSPQETFPWF